MDGAKTYAEFGIPRPAPCPSWCEGVHAGSYVDDRLRQVMRLIEETRDARRAGPVDAR